MGTVASSDGGVCGSQRSGGGRTGGWIGSVVPPEGATSVRVKRADCVRRVGRVRTAEP